MFYPQDQVNCTIISRKPKLIPLLFVSWLVSAQQPVGKVFCCLCVQVSTQLAQLVRGSKPVLSSHLTTPSTPHPVLRRLQARPPAPRLSCPPARSPPPPSCPAAVHNQPPSSLVCAAAIAALWRIDPSAERAPARKTDATALKKRRTLSLIAISNLHVHPLNNGWQLRRHAEVSLQFQGDLLSGAHLP